MAADNFRDLTVYKSAFVSAVEILIVSKKFSAEEKYSLTDQKIIKIFLFVYWISV